ncbi:phage major capsid protein [Pectinatus frisingensis]|uniref:phage major capsid protein n=1 Tax=Pectinatus frisingensis TaxID=865 RepID=UPI0018C82054|nr:phage major capsid protein [Pectinatus frisingensis]
MEKRLKEILDRKLEIRKTLIENKETDLSAIEKELTELETEESEIRKKIDIANKINTGTIPTNVIKKPEQEKRTLLDKFDTIEYRQAFFDYVKTGVMAAEYRGVTTTTSDAGAVIPTTTLNKIIEKMTSQGMILPLVTKTAYNTGVSIPTSTVKPVATWVADGATSDRQKKAIGNITFGANKLRCAVAVSFNLENMALSAFEAAIVQNIADAMTIALEQAIIAGDGVGKPSGILTATAPTGQTIDVPAIDYPTMVKAEAAIPAAYENGSVYVMTKKTFMAFVGMTDSNKQPIARVNYGINGAADRNLLGRKVIICDYLPSFDATQAAQPFAFIFKMDDYVLNTAFNVTLKQYEDYETDDIVRKAIMLADGKVVDTNSLVILRTPAAAAPATETPSK